MINSVYHKSPSIGFKLKDSKRFQISLKTDSEFDEFLKYLNQRGILNSDNTKGKKSTNLVSSLENSTKTHNLNPSSSSQLFARETELQPSSQRFIEPPHPYLVPSSDLYHDQDRKRTASNAMMSRTPRYNNNSTALVNNLSQSRYPITSSNTYDPLVLNDRMFPIQNEGTFSSSSLVQSNQYHAQGGLMMGTAGVGYAGVDDDVNGLGFLSQVLNEPQMTGDGLGKVDFDKMNNEEIKVIIREKIKDVNFINFVKRIEGCLKDLG